MPQTVQIVRPACSGTVAAKFDGMSRTADLSHDFGSAVAVANAELPPYANHGAIVMVI